jgi:hypothetical protein
MRTGLRVPLLALAVFLAAVSGLAQEKKGEPARPADMPPHIRAAYTFLIAWGKGEWNAAKAVAAENVVVKVGEKEFTLDLATGKAEATLVFPFKGLSTVRVEGKVKGVTVDEITLKAGETEKRGKGALTLEEKGGQFLVTGVAVE